MNNENSSDSDSEMIVDVNAENEEIEQEEGDDSNEEIENSGIEVSERETSFKKRIVSYEFINESHLDFKSFFQGVLKEFKKKPMNYLKKNWIM